MADYTLKLYNKTEKPLKLKIKLVYKFSINLINRKVNHDIFSGILNNIETKNFNIPTIANIDKIIIKFYDSNYKKIIFKIEKNEKLLEEITKSKLIRFDIREGKICPYVVVINKNPMFHHDKIIKRKKFLIF